MASPAPLPPPPLSRRGRVGAQGARRGTVEGGAGWAGGGGGAVFVCGNGNGSGVCVEDGTWRDGRRKVRSCFEVVEKRQIYRGRVGGASEVTAAVGRSEREREGGTLGDVSRGWWGMFGAELGGWKRVWEIGPEFGTNTLKIRVKWT